MKVSPSAHPVFQGFFSLAYPPHAGALFEELQLSADKPLCTLSSKITAFLVQFFFPSENGPGTTPAQLSRTVVKITNCWAPSRPTESESLGWNPRIYIFNKLPRGTSCITEKFLKH